MEWAIPLQKLEVGKIQIAKLQDYEKSIVPLGYFDGTYTFPYLNILLPTLTVEQFEPSNGKLILRVDTQEAKLLALQSSLLNAVYIQQSSWFPDTNFNIEDLKSFFKPIIENKLLYLYFPVQFNNDVHIYKDKQWHTKYVEGMIKKNDTIRIMFRIQGISFHKNNYKKNWSGKFRLQHRIIAILLG